jgi:hypothetical protein
VPGVGNILTGETAADDIDAFEIVFSTLSDVAFSVDVRPMLFEDLRRVVVNFHLPFADHSGPLETQIKPANPCKERPKRQRLFCCLDHSKLQCFE